MTHAQILANKLNGMEYGDRTIEDNEHYAKENDLLVLTGYSDDNIEIYGKFRDEVSMCNGGTFAMDDYEVKFECEDACDHCTRQRTIEEPEIEVTAEWGHEDYDWYIDASGPLVKEIQYFNIMEDGNQFCRGVVIQA